MSDTPSTTQPEISTAAVLFADICSSTALYKRLGDEAALHLIMRLLLRCEELSRRFGGVMIKTIGDEIMLRFPDAFNALSAAVEIQQMTESFGEETGTTLFLRIGVNAGEIQEDNGDVFGNTVNIAARFEDFASPGKIVTSMAVLDEANRHQNFEYRGLGTHKFKGVNEPIECCEVVWDVECLTIIQRPALADRQCRLILECNGATIELGGTDTVTIGRGKENAVQVDWPAVSRHHAIIEGKCTSFSLTDQSTNGTYVCEDGVPALHVHHETCNLAGSGRIILGQQEDNENRSTLQYRLVN